MNVLFKFLCFSTFLFASIYSYSQKEYEYEELDFNTKIKIQIEGKRKFNVHLNIGYNLSAVFGEGVNIRTDTLTAIKNRFNLDSYGVEPVFFPYGSIDFSFNFSRKISLTLGAKYSRLGWKDVAAYENTAVFFRFNERYDFHYISIPVALNIHLNPNISFFVGHTISVLVKNEINIKEIEIFNKDTLTNRKQTLDFTKVTDIESSKIIPHILLGTHFGSDRIRFRINFNLIPNFIRNDIFYNSISVETGILFKLFKDYDEI